MKRRDFLRIVGVLTGSTLISSCGSGNGSKKFISSILPPEEGMIPGEAVFSPSTCTECPAGCGLSVTLREGGPEQARRRAGAPGERRRFVHPRAVLPSPPVSPEEDRKPHAAKRRGEVPGDFLGEGRLPGIGIPRGFPRLRAEKPLPVRKDHWLPLRADRHGLPEARGREASRGRA